VQSICHGSVGWCEFLYAYCLGRRATVAHNDFSIARDFASTINF
jgi:hypothetical protein